jgi:hypothetical protein
VPSFARAAATRSRARSRCSVNASRMRARALGAGLGDERRGTRPRIREDRPALCRSDRSPRAAAGRGCVRRPSCFHAELSAKRAARSGSVTSPCASGTMSTSGCSAIIAARNCAGVDSCCDRRGDEHEEARRRAPRRALPSPRLGRHNHLGSRKAVTRGAEFITDVGGRRHQARRLRIRIETMRP